MLSAQRRALVVGTNCATVGLARLVQAHPGLPYRVVGFLDPDVTHPDSRTDGLPVLGGPDDLDRLARAGRVEDVLVVEGSLSGTRLRGLVETCRQRNVRVRMIPSMTVLLDGPPGGPPPGRDVEIEDLLRREPIPLDAAAIGSVIAARSVLVTGAGGSIGGEICRQILRFKPRSLVLVERAEHNLFLIERELRGLDAAAPLWPCIADVRDRGRVGRLLARHRPEVIFHAAAYKHVPMMEANCAEAIKNNVFGTKRLAELAHRHGVGRFVMISTDKAVRPSSIMGVTKLVAEQYVQALARRSSTRFVVVRFGNVLGSSGSVVPLFQEQIRRGGPVTVTHPHMRRYVMTIPEASQLVLQAAAMAGGGEVFVPDMGEPVKILDLAHDLIRLAGRAAEDVEIVFTGVRPGEKLQEELHGEEEHLLPSAHPKLFVASPRGRPLRGVLRTLAGLRKIAREPDDVIPALVAELVPAYAQARAQRPDGQEQVTPNGTGAVRTDKASG
jgi:FlaA1/EpsC-like NDP-sugar epimerase